MTISSLKNDNTLDILVYLLNTFLYLLNLPKIYSKYEYCIYKAHECIKISKTSKYVHVYVYLAKHYSISFKFVKPIIIFKTYSNLRNSDVIQFHTQRKLPSHSSSSKFVLHFSLFVILTAGKEGEGRTGEISNSHPPSNHLATRQPPLKIIAADILMPSSFSFKNTPPKVGVFLLQTRETTTLLLFPFSAC